MEVWKLSIDLIKSLYTLTNNFPKNEMFGITNQIRRAAISISSNLSEGSSRKSPQERKRFYEISRSSLVEIDTQLIISYELNYITLNEIENLNEPLNKLFAKLSNLISKTV
ncbi:MAG: four helix bundle protein [bacterium]|nr:four helix bundle protein [bacterium]